MSFGEIVSPFGDTGLMKKELIIKEFFKLKQKWWCSIDCKKVQL